MSVSNIPQSIKNKFERNLYKIPDHPICIIKQKVLEYFGPTFTVFEDLDKVVSTTENFDNLLIEKTHPSRSYSDTFYVNEETVLRTHTTAHQNNILRSGVKNFLVVGDVYRRDEVNRTHYPIFHQLEGVL